MSDQDNAYKTIAGEATDAKNTAAEELIEIMLKSERRNLCVRQKIGGQPLQISQQVYRA
ncbi:hypothetical protein HQ585_00725 [candidate division KSB1 bacterium]|nr:hypothetical protein [candidate division KSB1 bacterium]